MRIGFDIDGVLANLNVVLENIVKTRFNATIPDPNPHMDVIETYSGLTPEESKTYFWDLALKERIFAIPPSYPEFMEMFNKCVANDKLEVFVVTHRHYHHDEYPKPHGNNIIQKDTTSWFNKYAPLFNTDNIYYVQGHKSAKIKELGLQLFVDDRIWVAEEVADVCMSLLVDRPWNAKEKEEKSIRVFKPADVESIVSGLLSRKV